MREAVKCREVISSKMKEFFDRVSQDHEELLNVRDLFIFHRRHNVHISISRRLDSSTIN